MYNKETPLVRYWEPADSLEIIWSDDFFRNYTIQAGFSTFINESNEVVGICIHEVTEAIKKSKESSEKIKAECEGLSPLEMVDKIFSQRTFGPKIFYTSFIDGSDMLYVSWHPCLEDCDCEFSEHGANIFFRDRCNGISYVESYNGVDAINIYGVQSRIIKSDPAEGLIKPGDPGYDDPSFRPVEEFISEDEKEAWKQRLEELEKDREYWKEQQ